MQTVGEFNPAMQSSLEDRVNPAIGGKVERPAVSNRDDPSRPTRVLLVGPSLDYLGGQAVQAQRILARLRMDPDLSVEFLPVNPRLPGMLGRLQRVRYVRTVVTSLAYTASLLRAVRRFDVIHAYSASYWSFLLAPFPAILIGRLAGRGVILNYHSGEADDHLTRWRGTRQLLTLAHRIVVPNEYLEGVFARHGLKTSSIANHVEAGDMPVRLREKLRPTFFTNRNLEPHYGVDTVLRAFQRIQVAYPDATLVLAGTGSERNELEKLALELGLRGVSFIGTVPPGEMPFCYNAADIYLNGSRVDNMPLSLMEAFAAGLPVVTTDAGGIPCIVRHEENGLVVPQDDWERMAHEAIRLLENPPLARRISRDARIECTRRYSWQAVAGKWKRCYEELAGRRTRAMHRNPTRQGGAGRLQLEGTEMAAGGRSRAGKSGMS